MPHSLVCEAHYMVKSSVNRVDSGDTELGGDIQQCITKKRTILLHLYLLHHPHSLLHLETLLQLDKLNSI